MQASALVDAGNDAVAAALARIRGTLRVSLYSDECRIFEQRRDAFLSRRGKEGLAVVLVPVSGVAALGLLVLRRAPAAALIRNAAGIPANREVSLDAFTSQAVLGEIGSRLTQGFVERLVALQGTPEAMSVRAPEVHAGSTDSSAWEAVAKALPVVDGELTIAHFTLRVGPSDPAPAGEMLVVLSKPPEIPKETAGPRNPARLRLLLADPDEGSCALVSRWLASQHHVVVTRDGEETLRAALGERPDVVFLPASLPRLSSPSVAWALRHSTRYQGVPIVLMSSREDAAGASLLPWVEAFSDFRLVKPFTRASLDELLSVIERLPDPAPAPSDGRAVEERRLTPRVEVQIEASLQVRDRPAPARVVSLTPRGGYLECDGDLERNLAVRLEFDTPNGRFAGTGEVLYAETRKGRKGGAVQFHSLTPEAQRILVQVLGHASGMRRVRRQG